MLAVDVAERCFYSGTMGASAVSSSSGIAMIVGVGVAWPEIMMGMMECHTLALAQVSGVRAATVLSLRGSNHTLLDSCKLPNEIFSTNYTVQPCSIAKLGTTPTMGVKQLL